jgi:hypothetical protein
MATYTGRDRAAFCRARWDKSKAAWNKLTEAEQQARLDEVSHDDHMLQMEQWDRLGESDES